MFPGSPRSVPAFPSNPLLGIKKLTFLVVFLIPFIHPISLNYKPVGTGTLSFDVAAEHLEQGGICHKLGLSGSVVPKLRSEGLQVGWELTRNGLQTSSSQLLTGLLAIC